MRGSRWGWLLGWALIGSAVAQTGPRVLTPGEGSYDAVARFTAVLDLILQHHAASQPVNLAEVTRVALEQLAHAVDADAELVFENSAGQPQAASFGVLLTRRDNLPWVVSVRDGTTAQRAGVLPGEWITGIDRQPTMGKSLETVRRQLDGVVGTEVILELRDAAGTTRAWRLRRQAVLPARGTLRFLPGGFAYCRLPSLEPAAVETLREHVENAHRQQARGFILDLRSNPGGHLPAVAAAAESFLPARTPVGSVVFARGPRRTALATAYEPAVVQRPLVVLVNRGTAGEAELLAGALQAHGRAKLIGAATAGRGRVLQSFPLDGGGRLILPVAWLELPGGQRFDGQGVMPELVVQVARDKERTLAMAGYGLEPRNDPVIERALEWLRAGR